MLNNEIESISKEISVKYDITHDEGFRILIETISCVYNSVNPVIIKDDGAYLTHEDEDGFMDFTKIVFSKKRSKQIVDKLQENALKCYLNKSKLTVVNSVKNKKNYLYCEYSYSTEKHDHYNLYFDKKHEKIVRHAEGVCRLSKSKKSRLYINPHSALIVSNKILYYEYKKYVNMNNIIALTKELSREIHDKIDIKIWIEIRGFDFNKKEVYLYLPHKTLSAIIDFIELKYKEIFTLSTIFIYKEVND